MNNPNIQPQGEKDFAETLVDALLEAAIARGIYAAGGNVSNLTIDEVHAQIKAAKKDLLDVIRVPSPHTEDFLTVRDEFAKAALPSHIEANGYKSASVEAYRYADAMMQARKGGA